MFGLRKRRNPLDAFDVGIREMLGLIQEGVEWCERPVHDFDDAVYALDYIDRASDVLNKARDLGLIDK